MDNMWARPAWLGDAWLVLGTNAGALVRLAAPGEQNRIRAFDDDSELPGTFLWLGLVEGQATLVSSWDARAQDEAVDDPRVRAYSIDQWLRLEPPVAVTVPAGASVAGSALTLQHAGETLVMLAALPAAALDTGASVAGFGYDVWVASVSGDTPASARTGTTSYPWLLAEGGDDDIVLEGFATLTHLRRADSAWVVQPSDAFAADATYLRDGRWLALDVVNERVDGRQSSRVRAGWRDLVSEDWTWSDDLWEAECPEGGCAEAHDLIPSLAAAPAADGTTLAAWTWSDATGAYLSMVRLDESGAPASCMIVVDTEPNAWVAGVAETAGGASAIWASYQAWNTWWGPLP